MEAEFSSLINDPNLIYGKIDDAKKMVLNKKSRFWKTQYLTIDKINFNFRFFF